MLIPPLTKLVENSIKAHPLHAQTGGLTVDEISSFTAQRVHEQGRKHLRHRIERALQKGVANGSLVVQSTGTETRYQLNNASK
ncbi:hypothetical protein M408DRAFT_26062 [Serendipita vermifera MAFF 305830]|uniref:Histone H1 n=1 Tax=Serendipita vermifera MAFF 305830 TaxID=933852 RepID=A0A0C3ALP3_SERVB|nr:hypothetical protein M408DRAFT_26062 [Serendipita vermifera MAFF 305830]